MRLYILSHKPHVPNSGFVFHSFVSEFLIVINDSIFDGRSKSNNMLPDAGLYF